MWCSVVFANIIQCPGINLETVQNSDVIFSISSPYFRHLAFPNPLMLSSSVMLFGTLDAISRSVLWIFCSSIVV